VIAPLLLFALCLMTHRKFLPSICGGGANILDLNQLHRRGLKLEHRYHLGLTKGCGNDVTELWQLHGEGKYDLPRACDRRSHRLIFGRRATGRAE
jgi:hypothetical protein